MIKYLLLQSDKVIFTVMLLSLSICYGASSQLEEPLLGGSAPVIGPRITRDVEAGPGITEVRIGLEDEDEITRRYQDIFSNSTAAGIESIRTQAAAGDKYAQTAMGIIYMEGRGTSKNLANAFEWFTLAANQSFSSAQYRLGGLILSQVYKIGPITLGGDPVRAINLYERSAAQGNAKAQFYLGAMYYYGWGISSNKEKGRELFRQAAERGYVKAQESLAYEYGIDETERNQEEYKREAARWALAAARQGSLEGQYRYATYCATGYGIPVNFVEAVKWYRLVLEHVNEEEEVDRRAAFGLAKILEEDHEGVPANLAEAKKLYEIASGPTSEYNYKEAYYRAGRLYEGVPGLDSNLEKAVQYYKRATADFLVVGGNLSRPTAPVIEATYRLGRLYEEGRGVEQNDSYAAYCYKSAADKGHAEAREKLEALHAQGRGLTVWDHVSNSCIIM